MTVEVRQEVELGVHVELSERFGQVRGHGRDAGGRVAGGRRAAGAPALRPDARELHGGRHAPRQRLPAPHPGGAQLHARAGQAQRHRVLSQVHLRRQADRRAGTSSTLFSCRRHIVAAIVFVSLIFLALFGEGLR